jgi:hypothetical protein
MTTWTQLSCFLLGLSVTLVPLAPVVRGQVARAAQKTPEGVGREHQNGPPPPSLAERLRIRGMPTTPVVLITWKAIQDELKLNPAQVTRIKAINADYDLKRQTLGQDMSKPGGRLAPAALAEWITSVRTEQEGAIAAVLSRGQSTRLEQISLQIEGLRCVARAEIAERINLDAVQLEMIQQILDQMKATQDQQWKLHVEQIAAAGAGSAKQMTTDNKKKVATQSKPDPVELAHLEQVQIEDEAARQIARVLTRGQRKTLSKLMGNPFDLSRLRPGGTAAQGDLPQAETPSELEPIPGATVARPPNAPPAKREKKTQRGAPPQSQERK